MKNAGSSVTEKCRRRKFHKMKKSGYRAPSPPRTPAVQPWPSPRDSSPVKAAPAARQSPSRYALSAASQKSKSVVGKGGERQGNGNGGERQGSDDRRQGERESPYEYSKRLDSIIQKDFERGPPDAEVRAYEQKYGKLDMDVNGILELCRERQDTQRSDYSHMRIETVTKKFNALMKKHNVFFREDDDPFIKECVGKKVWYPWLCSILDGDYNTCKLQIHHDWITAAGRYAAGAPGLHISVDFMSLGWKNFLRVASRLQGRLGGEFLDISVHVSRDISTILKHDYEAGKEQAEKEKLMLAAPKVAEPEVVTPDRVFDPYLGLYVRPSRPKPSPFGNSLDHLEFYTRLGQGHDAPATSVRHSPSRHSPERRLSPPRHSPERRPSPFSLEPHGRHNPSPKSPDGVITRPSSPIDMSHRPSPPMGRSPGRRSERRGRPPFDPYVRVRDQRFEVPATSVRRSPERDAFA